MHAPGGAGNTTTSFTIGDQNRISTDGTYDYIYDNEGNLIEKRDHATSDPVFEYTYDYRNRLIEVSENGGEIVHHYTYDPFDRLVAMDSDTSTDYVAPPYQVFVYDGNQVVMHFQSGDTPPMGLDALYERNLYGPVVDMLLAQDDGSLGELAFWPLPDYHNSNVDSVVKIGSTIYEGYHLRFDSFGNDLYVDSLGDPNDSDGSAFSALGWTGRIHDTFAESGSLQWNGHRVYNSELATWMTEDPIGYAGDPSNLYRYVGNSPTNYVDPTGMDRYMVTNGFHWWLVVDQWAITSGDDPTLHVIGYTALDYSACGYSMRPADTASQVNRFWSTNGPGAFGSWVVYKYHSNPKQDLNLLTQWAKMRTTPFSWHWGFPLGYLFGINCISVSDFWARYGGDAGKADPPIYVGPEKNGGK